MACYDCEDCSKSIDEGGKCTRFEYDCPFTIVAKYDAEKLKSIRAAIKKISDAVEDLKNFDSEYGYMEDEISFISCRVSDVADKVSEDIEKEWNEIK